MHLSDINFLAVIIAAVAAFLIGFIWYSVLFGKSWQKELGFTDEYLRKGNMPLIFGSSFIMMLLMSFGIALLLQVQHLETADPALGLHTGILVGFFFVATSTAINYLYQRRSIKLWLIDAGYQFVFLAIMGVIHGYLR